MFQIDEKVISDSRTLITIQGDKQKIDPLTKNGTIHYTMNDDNLWFSTPEVRKTYIQKKNYFDKLDKIVVARDGTLIDGDYEFKDKITFLDDVEIKKDLVVRGDLTVEGNSTVIDTPRLSIEDNIIELNRNEVGSGVTLRRSGTAVNRGQLDFSRWIYDEDQKAFVVDLANNMESVVNEDKWVYKAYTGTTGEYVAGELRARYRLTAPFGKFTDSLSVAKNTTLNNLLVNGTSSFKGTVTADSSVTINGPLVSNNTSTFNGLLTANKVATFNDNVVMKKLLTVDGASTFNSLATFNKGIVIKEGATITGPTDLDGTLNVRENATFQKDIDVKATTTTNNLVTKQHSKTNTLEVTSNVSVGGNTQLTGSVNIDGVTTIKNNTTITATVVTTNARSEFNGDINVNNKNVVIKSNASSNGNLAVQGDESITRTLTVGGVSTFNADVNTKENLTVTKQTKSNAFLTETNYRLAQGDFNGVRFWDSDNYKIYMAAQGSTYGGRMDSTSDYNMYFRMATGSNRGFVFKNDMTNLLQIEGSGQVRVKEKIIAHGYDVITRENEGHRETAQIATGINADRLDGLHDFDFLRRNVDTNTTGAITFNTAGKAINFNGGGSIYRNGAIVIKTSNAINDGVKVISEGNVDLFTVKDNAVNGLMYKTHTVWHKGNQGHSTGMDADMLDGKHKEYFATADHLHDDRYIRNDEVNLKGKYKIEYNEDFDCLDFMYMGDTP